MTSASEDDDVRATPWTDNAAPTDRRTQLALGQFWQHRELIYFFALRDLKVRYKQAFLGVAWAGLQPLLGALAFTILFNRLIDVDLDGRSYLVFALVGFSAWTYFSSTVSSGATSIVYNAELFTKVAFPKVVAPAAALLPGLVDLAIGLTLAMVVAIAVGEGPTLSSVAELPLGLAMLLAGTAGPVLFFSASMVKYRDAAVLLTFGLQILLFASPVGYPPELAPGGWQTMLYLSPITGSLGLLRAAVSGAEAPGVGHLALSGTVAMVLFVMGALHFRRRELEFADII